MSTSLTPKIAEAFDRAALHYDANALLQKRVAHQLASKLVQRYRPDSIFEIGCGTGFLTESLLQAYPASPYMATDIAPSMVNACRAKLGHHPQLTCAVQDGQAPLSQHYDWIISSLTLQWFENLEMSLSLLWQHTDVLAFTTLVDGTLQEWQELCHQHGIKDGVQPFMEATALKDICERLAPKRLIFDIVPETDTFDNVLSFLRTLKAIGAHTSPSAHTSVPLMKVLKGHERPFTGTYHVAYCILQK